jgi:preprotein translocase subunit SecE
MAGKSVVQFMHEVRGELGKIVWPKFPSLVESTIVVLVLIIVFAIYLGIIDFGLTQLLQYIIKNY